MVGAFSLLLLLGLLQLHQLRGQGEELELLRTRLAELETPSTAPVPAAEPAFGRGAVVAVLQPEDLDRIAQAVAARLAPPTAEEAESAPRPPSPEQVELSREASERVERSIASGTLRKDDVLALRKLRGKLDPAAFDALLQQLVLAMNAQRLVPEDPLFALP